MQKTKHLIILLGMIILSYPVFALNHSDTISSNETWYAADNPHIIDGNVTVDNGVTLTIEQGCEVYFDGNYYLRINGVLEADGTSGNHIIFTSNQITPEKGDWQYLYFYNADPGCILDYCDILYGGANQGNVFINNSDANVSITNCTIEESGSAGVRTANSDLAISNSTIGDNTTYGLYFNNSNSTIEDCILENNHTGLYSNSSIILDNVDIWNNTNTGIYSLSNTPQLSDCQVSSNNVYEIYANNAEGYPEMTNTTITGNGSIIVVGAGTMDSDRTFFNFGGDYEITGDINVQKTGDNPRLTIEAGNTLKFSTGARLTIAGSSSHGGELFAQGTAGNEIVFTALNGLNGGWDGIRFRDGSDANGSTSTLEYCVIEKAGGGSNGYNVSCDLTTQPATISNCVIRNSEHRGIYLQNASIPIADCLIDSCGTYGLYFNNNSNSTVTDCTTELNHTGIYSNSSIILNNIIIRNNTNTGFKSGDNTPELTDCQIYDNNVYEIYAYTAQGYPEMTNTTVSGNGSKIVVGAGTMDSDRIFFNFGGDYEILGDVNVQKNGDNPRLTIEAGNTLKFDTGARLHIAYTSTYGGELFAAGTAGNEIIFTALNGNPGGWDGIHFRDGSDSYGSESTFEHCVVEKAGAGSNGYNIYCKSTVQPDTIRNCVFRSSEHRGVYLNNAPIYLTNCTIDSNATYGIYFNNSTNSIVDTSTVEYNSTGIYSNSGVVLDSVIISNNTNTGINSGSITPELINCQISNNNVYEIYAFTAEGYPEMTGTTVSGNGSKIVVGQGTMDSDRIFFNMGGDYEITGDISVHKAADNPRLIIEPGNTLKFSNGARLHIAYTSTYGGELFALGTADSLITFTALNGLAGGWDGIQFRDGSDSYGSESILEYCIVVKAGAGSNGFNISCETTTQPDTIRFCQVGNSEHRGISLNNSPITVDSCFIDSCGTYGLYFSNSDSDVYDCTTEYNQTGIYSNSNIYLENVIIQENSQTGFHTGNNTPELINCQISNNNVYEIYAFTAEGYPEMLGTTVSGNGSKIIVGAGTMDSDRIFFNFRGDYEIMGDVNVQKNGDNPRLTIEAGNTLKFTTGARLHIAYSSTYGGELFARGTADSLITFTALNGITGGWDGIQFRNGSDSYGSESIFEYCLVEKAGSGSNGFNIDCDNTTQPDTIRYCQVGNSEHRGIYLNYSPITVDSCFIDSCGTYGIYCSNSAASVYECTIENNQTGIYSNSNIYLDNVIIQENSNTGIHTGNNTPELINCQISNNNIYEIYAFTAEGYPEMTNTTIIGNGSKIVVGAGTIDSDRIFPYFGGDYEVLGDVNVQKNGGKARLTIAPGNLLKFAIGARLHIAYSASYGGELFAPGTADSLITFTALNGISGGWDGIQFRNGSDAYGSESTLEYCVIEKAGAGSNGFNINCENTTQPDTISNCSISDSEQRGLYLNNSFIALTNCVIDSCATYGIYLSGTSNPTFGSVLAEWNDIYNSGSQNLYNNTSNNITAEYIYWGTVIESEIENMIYDQNENGGLGLVDFTPWTNAAHDTEYPVVAPSAPQNVIITIIAGNVNLEWDAVAGATSYKIYSSSDPYAAYPWTFEVEITVTNWSEVAADVKKFYYVTAVN